MNEQTSDDNSAAMYETEHLTEPKTIAQQPIHSSLSQQPTAEQPLNETEQPLGQEKNLLQFLAPPLLPSSDSVSKAIALVNWLNSAAAGWYNPQTLELTNSAGSNVLELIKYVVQDEPRLHRIDVIVGVEDFLRLIRNLKVPSHMLGVHVNRKQQSNSIWTEYTTW
jgi:hypothetical protein